MCRWIFRSLALLCIIHTLIAADEISITTVAPDGNLDVGITDIAKETDARLLLFSTLNGNLYAIDQETGSVKWKIRDRPIITVPKDGVDALNSVFLPDPKDGSLYVITNTKERIKKLGFTIPELVTSSPCRSSDGILYTGKKKDTWFMLDPKTGNRQQILGWDILHGPTCPVQTPDAIYIGRTEYSLRMVDSKQSNRRWNVTFYEYAAVPMDKDTAALYDFLHFTSSSTGVVLTLDRRRGSIVWEKNFDSPVIGAYILDPDGLISLPFTSLSNQTLLNFANNLLEEERGNMNAQQMKLYPTLYIGEHPEGLYALPSFVDQNMVTITNADGRPLLLEGPDGEHRPSGVIIDYPLPGQDYPLPHDAIMDTMTFQSVPTHSKSFSIIYLGHYDLPKYANEKFLLPGQPINGKLLTDESKINLPRAKPIYDARFPWLQMAFSFLTTILVTVLTMQACLKYSSREITEKVSVETPDGCVRIGKISFNKCQLLGKGCEGTFVYRGEFEGRRVAVKRLLPECFDFADREVALLRESDAHPNVVRYFCTEQDQQFRYIALELCQATLNEYISNGVSVPIGKLEILQQATAGLAHLHSLDIVHRDIKPQNVLLSVTGPNGRVRAMISDFGLSKKLQLGKASFSKRSGLTGTEGWIAPEMLREGESITCAVDLFSFGCLFYYVLSDGGHPFGDSLHRQANILENCWSMDEFVDSIDKIQLYKLLLTSLISNRPNERPDCRVICGHPMFWSNQTVLAFFQDVSDRVEKSDATDPVLLALEANSQFVVRGDWKHHIDQEVSSDLRKYRNYRGNSLRDLLRALRNKKHHYHELTRESQVLLGEIPEKFTMYWTTRFPLLLVHTWVAMQMICDEDNFKQYYFDFIFPNSSVDYQLGAEDAEKFKFENVDAWKTSNTSDTTQNGEAIGLYRLSPQKRDSTNANRYNPNRRRGQGYRKNSNKKEEKSEAASPVWLLPPNNPDN
ncbi:serine/threonine-protein kinase/endoribonuclease IRE1 [Atheta coriaria]|uniref:serine/threonine-protein kinase/endoribonuclease IRE1 n=1 Tax=Dalotia coriaria TaxID=877792 RepID=UPI0031F3BBEC